MVTYDVFWAIFNNMKCHFYVSISIFENLGLIAKGADKLSSYELGIEPTGGTCLQFWIHY